MMETSSNRGPFSNSFEKEGQGTDRGLTGDGLHIVPVTRVSVPVYIITPVRDRNAFLPPSFTPS